MNKKYPFKIGLFGIGLEAYWAQFEGLKQRLEGYLKTVEKRLGSYGVQVVNAGLVDSPEKAFDVGHYFRRQDVDLIFLHVTTYALSSTVLPVVQRVGVPVIILNLSPEAAIDYEWFNSLADRTQMTGEWLAHCGACPVPEISNVFKRAGIDFYQVTGILDEQDSCWKEIREWVEAAGVAHTMAHNRLGCMGHYYSGMLDIYTDLTLQQAIFGGHIELIEVDELTELRLNQVTDDEIHRQLEVFNREFNIQPDCTDEALREAACTAVALDKLVEKYDLSSLAYYYKGSGQPENEVTIATIILGNSLLTARGIPVAGEYEIKNAQAMKILDSFGAGGSFTEYYAMDYIDDIVLMGHDGPGHIKIAEGKTKVRPLGVYHGKIGQGLSVEMSVKHGPVTLLSVVESPEGIFLLVAEGESVPGPILEIGNTNSRYRFSIGARGFVEAWNSYGPAHHCAVGIGHISSKIKKLSFILKVPMVQVC